MASLMQQLADLIVRGGLNTYDSFVDRANLPSNQRIYMETVLDKNQTPITEQSFTAKELETISNLIKSKGGKSGAIKYEDYPKAKEGESALARPLSGEQFPYENIRTTLGQFTYKMNPKTNKYDVSDMYDFNAFPKTKDIVGGDYVGRYAISPYLMLRAYGQNVVPEGGGRKVNIAVPGLLGK